MRKNFFELARRFEPKITPRWIKDFGLLIESQIYYEKYKKGIENLKLIAVTGTDGKTTTSTMIYEALKSSGFKAGLISTIAAKIGDKDLDTGFHVTTPSPRNLYKYFSQMYEEGIQIVVLEVTAHAIAQNRIHGLKFESVVYTNVTHNEHLDYFKTYKNYLNVKSKLLSSDYLKKGGTAVINIDDESYSTLKNIFRQREDIKIIEYGIDDKLKLLVETQAFPLFNIDENGSYIFAVPGTNVSLKIIGYYNIYNSLAAFSALRSFNCDEKKIINSLNQFSAPDGRMNIVMKNPFYAIVDFAHTPNALENALYSASKLLKANGKLISIFGCASQRDESKRPIMGKIAQKYSDIVFLVPEDPRFESVEKINNEIMSQTDKAKFECFNESSPSSRSNAIKKALGIAKSGDVVIILGKGHEKSLNFNGVEYPWNDKEEIEKYVKIQEQI